MEKIFRIELRACLKTPMGPVFEQKAQWQGARREHTPSGSVTDEQRSQRAFCSKTQRAASLLAVAFVGSTVTARCGDAPVSPPRSQPKSFAAGPIGVFKQALSEFEIGQAIDGLEARAQAWADTAHYLRTGEMPNDFFVAEECNNLEEASRLASSYRSIIRKIRSQRDEQKLKKI